MLKKLEKLGATYISMSSRVELGFDAAAVIQPEVVRRAAQMFREDGWHLESIHAIDAKEGFVVFWLFDRYESPSRHVLRALVPHEEPTVPSIADIFPGAEWHERETKDFHGVEFEGNPNPVPLLLPADADFHPLVKEDKSRKPVGDLLAQGSVVCVKPECSLFGHLAETDQEGDA